MNRNTYYTVLIGLLIVLCGAFIWFYQAENPLNNTNNGSNTGNQTVVRSFEECVNAGYPVMESTPRQCRAANGETFVENIGNTYEKADLIRVSSPRPNDTVSSPLILEGEARGKWYFEASFPVRILDANGVELGVVPAQAQGEWMTENFVPFKATLSFRAATTQTGTLVFQKDNPSGLPEHDDELRMPIKFGASSQTMATKVYFGKKGISENDCSATVAVDRVIPKTQAVAQASLEALLQGPTASEQQAGYYTTINPNVKIQKLTIENGVAKVDFDEELQSYAGGSCRVTAIRAQIEQTLKQFPTVKSVVISIDGRTQDILQP